MQKREMNYLTHRGIKLCDKKVLTSYTIDAVINSGEAFREKYYWTAQDLLNPVSWMITGHFH